MLHVRHHCCVDFAVLQSLQVLRRSYHSALYKNRWCGGCADTFIQKTKKLYVDTRTQRNMAKLTEDITEVHSIMTKNIQDVLNHGERLDSE